MMFAILRMVPEERKQDILWRKQADNPQEAAEIKQEIVEWFKENPDPNGYYTGWVGVSSEGLKDIVILQISEATWVMYPNTRDNLINDFVETIRNRVHAVILD